MTNTHPEDSARNPAAGMAGTNARLHPRREIRLADGRCLTYREYGARNGAALIALHGTPGSGLKFASAHETAERLGLRLVCPDRWGYGSSIAPPAVKLARYGADLSELADRLAIDRFGLLGVSGGGPFAAASATLLGHRLTRLGLVCPVGPIRGDVSGIAPFHRFSFLVLPRIPGAVRAVFAAYRLLAFASPHGAVLLAVARAGPADRALMWRRDLGRGLAECFRDGLRHGVAGPVIDMALFGRAWAMPERPACPAHVWLGQHDRNVPLAAARRLAQGLSASITQVEGQGHYWLAADCEPVLRWFCDPDLQSPAGVSSG